MDNVKTDAYFANKIRNDLMFVRRHTKNLDIGELRTNELLLDSMLFRLIQISENARKMSDGYKSEHPEIPWVSIYGLRNRIVHDYGNVDLRIVYETLTTDIPNLLGLFENDQEEV